MPVVLINTLPRAAQPALGLRDLLAVGVWASGFGLEIVADRRESDRVEERCRGLD